MRKPQGLREAIEARNPDLVSNPDKLKIYVREGAIALRLGESRGYQYNYRVEIDIINFTGNTNTVILPITDWIRVNQSDLLLNHDRADDAIKFQVDVIDNETCDISLAINLTEAVDVKTVNNQEAVVYRGEVPAIDGPLSDPASTLQRIFDEWGQLTPPIVE